MKYRDYIIGPEEILGIPKGYILAIPEGSNSTIGIPFPDREELYRIALNHFSTWNVQTCAVEWKGTVFRASTGIPIDRIREGFFPIVYFREPTKMLKEPEELGYPISLIEKFKKIKTGLVLFCGAQGSGKTTGMNSILRKRVRDNGERAVTFEAPIEYAIQGIHGKGFIDQVPVPNENFFTQCASISLRMASPDIVCYGEIRNYTGVQELCNNAFSSHVVMATLHSQDLVSGINRLVTFLTAGDVTHREYFMRVLSECLKLCVYQKLVPYNGQTRLAIEYLEYTEELRSAIYSGATSARISEILERQNILRAEYEM